METENKLGHPTRALRPLVFVFFATYLALGLMLARDYGMSWDEEYERLHGLVVMDYFNDLSGGRLFDQPFSEYKLETYFNRHYGTAFQTVAMLLERSLGLDDTREWYLLRHYMTFLVWFIALVFFYKLLQERFKNTAFSLVGVIFMILSPRIFADAFYNSKDIIFLSFYIISTYSLVKFLQRPSLKTAFYFALSSALLINTRILGVIMPLVGMAFVSARIMTEHRDKRMVRSYLLNTSYTLFLLFLLTVLFWPYLWESPFVRLVESFRTMGHFPWDDPVLYWGKFIPATRLPFHYILSWILITTPLLYTLFFLAGAVFTISRPLKSQLDEQGLIDLLNFVLFLLPLLAVIVLHSTLYDGWRQMFFLYGPFMMLALTGFEGILRSLKGLPSRVLSMYSRLALFLAIAWTLGSVTFFMVMNHPSQNVYFNFIAGKQTTKNFDADYWGLSYRQALEYILEVDERDTIPVFTVNYPGKANVLILKPEQQRRLVYKDLPGEADYWLSNYRFPSEHERYFRHDWPYDRPLWELMVKKNPVVGVYLLKD